LGTIRFGGGTGIVENRGIGTAFVKELGSCAERVSFGFEYQFELSPDIGVFLTKGVNEVELYSYIVFWW